ncbi:MAG: NfeD family protein [Methyloligellaceae bacterium]|nr:MAG: NfeD family protein [Alphaproteobacteria bacterium]
MEFQSFFVELGVWNWLIVGGLFLLLELLAPGIFLIWFGIAAIAVGLVAMTVDMAWQWQLVLFALFSLVTTFLGYTFLRPGEEISDRPLLNRRAQQLVGKSFVLAEDIRNGRGKVKIGDTEWRVEGPDAPAGARVKVVQADGALLLVEPERDSAAAGAA